MASKQIAVLTRVKGISEDVARRCARHALVHLDPKNGKNPLEDEKVRDSLSKTEVMFCDLTYLTPYMDCFPNLKWVQSTFAGIDVLLPLIKEQGKPPPFTLTRLGHVFKHQMAEYVVAHIISRERSFNKLKESQKAHKWDRNYINYRILPELTLGVLGVGEIGQTIATYCKSMGMTVYGLKSNNILPENTEPFLDKWFARDDLPSMLQQSDYVCNVLPATSLTNGILSNGILKHCGNRKSVFINVGRGNVIRDEEVVEALEKGWIQSAILDVFEEEPLPPSSPLWDMDNVFITPHCSSTTLPREAVNLFVENLERYEKGETLKYIVDWTKEY